MYTISTRRLAYTSRVPKQSLDRRKATALDSRHTKRLGQFGVRYFVSKCNEFDSRHGDSVFILKSLGPGKECSQIESRISGGNLGKKSNVTIASTRFRHSFRSWLCDLPGCVRLHRWGPQPFDKNMLASIVEKLLSPAFVPQLPDTLLRPVYHIVCGRIVQIRAERCKRRRLSGSVLLPPVVALKAKLVGWLDLA